MEGMCRVSGGAVEGHWSGREGLVKGQCRVSEGEV